MNNRMVHRAGGLLLLLLMVFLLMNGGCSPMYYGSVRPSTAESRIEAELVTRAELVRVDTSPFPHGRFAFRRGADHLLVITRITSFATDGSGNLHRRQDAIKERVWITIPFGAPMGHELSLGELEQVFNAGYDREARQDGDVGYLIRPNKTTGRVSLDELGFEKAIVTISARIAPRGISTFEIHEELEVPVTMDGIHATMVVEEKVYHHDPADGRRINQQTPVLPMGFDPAGLDEAAGGEGGDNTQPQSRVAK